jgi:predicted phage gp36 major capsid-like protein
VSRPGASIERDDDFERKDAAALCVVKHNLTIPKHDGSVIEYTPSPSEIDEALTAKRAVRTLFRYGGDQNRLPLEFRKSLSSFSLGSNGFILAPEISNQVLSCLIDPTDVTGLMNNVTISGGSIKFLIDHVRMADAAWACEASCFENNPQPDLQQGLGELEIKAETLRYVACASNDLLEDSSFPIETWLMRKAADGFRRTINNAVIAGDGIGKPLGLLSANAGIPIMDTAPNTVPGQFTWQDVVLLKYEVPMQWHAGGSYLMTLGIVKHLGAASALIDDGVHMGWRMVRVGDFALLEKPSDRQSPRRIDCYHVVEQENFGNGKRAKLDPACVLFSLRYEHNATPPDSKLLLFDKPREWLGPVTDQLFSELNRRVPHLLDQLRA